LAAGFVTVAMSLVALLPAGPASASDTKEACSTDSRFPCIRLSVIGSGLDVREVHVYERGGSYDRAGHIEVFKMNPHYQFVRDSPMHPQVVHSEEEVLMLGVIRPLRNHSQVCARYWLDVDYTGVEVHEPGPQVCIGIVA
jgi:hypothetical protein